MSLFFKDSLHVYRAAPLAAFEWLEHGFGTRRSTVWNADPRLVSLRQVHSDVCVEADGRAGCLGEGDALMTAVPGAVLSVRTADCVPLLIVDPERRAVAAVHAGWRGTVWNIAARTVAALAERFGSRAEDLQAAIGPGIGECCYEVGPEVAVQFRGIFPERAGLDARARIDLSEANRRQLSAAGLRPDRVYVSGLCTSCLADDFHSWRRDRRKTGRMLSVVGIRRRG